jgi:putative intracellular protease/amidase
MAVRNVYMYVLDTLADWEPVYILSELNSGRGFKKGSEPYRVKTFGLSRQPVVSMGGITILPDLTIDQIRAEDTSLLLLPGAETWLEPQHKPVIEKAREFLQENILVAAICGATEALAKAGILNDFRHTGNSLKSLNQFPHYKAEKKFADLPAVTDRNLITAPGVAPLEFAFEVFKKLDVFSATVLENWYYYYKTQDPKYLANLFKEISPDQESGITASPMVQA